MSLNRLLRYINLLVAFALVAVLGAVYWFAYRVLPKTSGEITAPIGRTATITRDEIGVPHISSESIEDALFLQGYVTAQDRLFQMDALRRVAGGTLAEVMGPRMLDNDREARRLRLRRIAEMHYGNLSEQDRAHLSAYALGVNYFLETHLNSLPLEFTLLDYSPRPWMVTDSILIGLLMFRDLTMSWQDEIRKRDLLAQGEEPLNSAQAARGGSKGKKTSADLAAPGESVVREFLESAQAARGGSKGKKNSADLAAPRESVVREFLESAQAARRSIKGKKNSADLAAPRES
ncbi:MAG: penicillin acylase family protein [Bryobacteraceae bacterium]